jgi:hypothetical protein
MMTFKYKKTEEEPNNNGYKQIVSDRDEKIQRHTNNTSDEAQDF